MILSKLVLDIIRHALIFSEHYEYTKLIMSLVIENANNLGELLKHLKTSLSEIKN
jgi:hypothetical protein